MQVLGCWFHVTAGPMRQLGSGEEESTERVMIFCVLGIDLPLELARLGNFLGVYWLWRKKGPGAHQSVSWRDHSPTIHNGPQWIKDWQLSYRDTCWLEDSKLFPGTAALTLWVFYST